MKGRARKIVGVLVGNLREGFLLGEEKEKNEARTATPPTQRGTGKRQARDRDKGPAHTKEKKGNDGMDKGEKRG